MERLRLRAPPFSAKWADERPAFVAWYVAEVGKRGGEACGARLTKRVGEGMNSLGAHLRLGDDTLTPLGRGDCRAFEDFLDMEWKFEPKDASNIRV